MALVKYHKRGMFKKIGTKRISKKLGVKITSMGWSRFYITKLNGKNYEYHSMKESLEVDTKEIIKEIGIENLKK